MKKLINTLYVLLLVILMSACSWGKVGEKQIKQDLQNKFEESKFIVNEITIDTASHEKKLSVYNITAMMSASNAEIKRMYTLMYRYYDTGGWIMDSCMETNQEEWAAIPHSYDISDEQLCDVIFEKSSSGGYYLQDVENAKFYNWTTESISDLPKTNNLKSREYVEKENGTMKVIAKCEAHSKEIEIFEDIETTWVFNKQTLEWNCMSKKSLSSDYNFSVDYSGKYCRNDDELIIKKKEKGFTISGCVKYVLYVGNDSEYTFNDVPIKVTGLFSMSASIKDEGYVRDPEENEAKNMSIDFGKDQMSLYYNNKKYEKQ